MHHSVYIHMYLWIMEKCRESEMAAKECEVVEWTSEHYLMFNTIAFLFDVHCSTRYFLSFSSRFFLFRSIPSSQVYIRRLSGKRNNLLFNNFLHFLLRLMWFRVINLRFHCVLRIFFVRQSLKNCFPLSFVLPIISTRRFSCIPALVYRQHQNKNKKIMV